MLRRCQALKAPPTRWGARRAPPRVARCGGGAAGETREVGDPRARPPRARRRWRRSWRTTTRRSSRSRRRRARRRALEHPIGGQLPRSSPAGGRRPQTRTVSAFRARRRSPAAVHGGTARTSLCSARGLGMASPRACGRGGGTKRDDAPSARAVGSRHRGSRRPCRRRLVLSTAGDRLGGRPSTATAVAWHRLASPRAAVLLSTGRDSAERPETVASATAARPRAAASRRIRRGAFKVVADPPRARRRTRTATFEKSVRRAEPISLAGRRASASTKRRPRRTRTSPRTSS